MLVILDLAKYGNAPYLPEIYVLPRNDENWKVEREVEHQYIAKHWKEPNRPSYGLNRVSKLEGMKPNKRCLAPFHSG